MLTNTASNTAKRRAAVLSPITRILHLIETHNASNKRRPDRGVRWRPQAGTNLIALLELFAATGDLVKFDRRRWLEAHGIPVTYIRPLMILEKSEYNMFYSLISNIELPP